MSGPGAVVVGSTGLVGSFILLALRTGHPSPFTSIDILARRSVTGPPGAKVPVKEFIDKDLSQWVPHLSSLSPTPSTFFSALATTRAAAGSFEKQYKLEHDFNLELAKAAKQAGTKIFVLISSGSAHPKSRMFYTRMKGELEENVKALGFDHTIILRPGLIVGNREESRPAEALFRSIANGLGHISSSLVNPWAQHADTIAKAAVLSAARAERGEIKDKVLILSQSDIIRVGEKEWKAATS